MSDEARAVLEAASKLPPDQQILVAEALYDLAGEGPASEEEFIAEMERRAGEAGQGIPWETVRDMR
jgi:hypothetical protein